MSLISHEVKVTAAPPLVSRVCSPSHHTFQGSEILPLQHLHLSTHENSYFPQTHRHYPLASSTTNLNMTRITSPSPATIDSEVTYAEIAGAFDGTKTMSDQLQVLLNITRDANELGQDREPLKDFHARLEQRQYARDEARKESIAVNNPTERTKPRR
jgi:hypothetical protein